MANLITLGRLGLLMLTAGLLLAGSPLLAALAAIGTALVIGADVFDGWVARLRGESSRFGALLDIAGDRAVEAVYLVVFANLGLIPLWPVILVLVRGFLVDAVHAAGAMEGYTAFGPTTHLRGEWSRRLSASRWSRALYGGAKAVTFTYLSLLAAGQAARLAPGVQAGAFRQLAPGLAVWSILLQVGVALTLFTTGFCLLRGLPVLYEGRRRFWPARR